MLDLRKKFNSAVSFIDGMGARRLNVYSASGAYYLFMSLVPIVMIICCLLPYTPLTQELMLGYIKDYIPESMAELVESIVGAVYDSSAATLTISILLTLFSASSAIKALMRGMDAAYGVTRREHFLLFRLRALVYMVILLAATVLSLSVMVYGGKILSLIQSSLSQAEWLDRVFYYLRFMRFLVVLCVLTLVFSALYTWMPAGKLKVKHQWPGAVFASVSWALFSWGFSFYVSVSNKYGAYGFIGTVMIAMIWIYFCLFFLLAGGYLNSQLSEKTKKAALQRGPLEEKRENGDTP